MLAVPGFIDGLDQDRDLYRVILDFLTTESTAASYHDQDMDYGDDAMDTIRTPSPTSLMEANVRGAQPLTSPNTFFMDTVCALEWPSSSLSQMSVESSSLFLYQATGPSLLHFPPVFQNLDNMIQTIQGIYSKCVFVKMLCLMDSGLDGVGPEGDDNEEDDNDNDEEEEEEDDDEWTDDDNSSDYAPPPLGGTCKHKGKNAKNSKDIGAMAREALTVEWCMIEGSGSRHISKKVTKLVNYMANISDKQLHSFVNSILTVIWEPQ